ncbi:MAG: four helix bundle protein [Bacteroidaceae bacterium]|nr:four helix bundle protein [Bacteroidaceae bacterium]
MKKENILAEKTTKFAIRVVRCYKYLTEEKKEYVMSKQLLRCGTSVGANTYESFYAQTRADFISKLSIALKEASETSYWFIILHETGFLDEKLYTSLKTDIDEIIRIIISSIKTSRNNANEDD